MTRSTVYRVLVRNQLINGELLRTLPCPSRPLTGAAQ